jgi:dihydropteroate synthase
LGCREHQLKVRKLFLNNYLVMGILNLTPDSFSDGGLFLKPAAALQQARQLVAEGADYLDIGGESSRPGAAAVSVQEELDRVMPVIEAVRAQLEVKISLDTVKPEVMRAGLAAGVDMINDINALRAEDALACVAASHAEVCLMHMQGTPRTMQQAPHYDDVVGEVKAFLAARLHACVDAGISAERVWLDPGFGFGKTVAHNLRLLAQLQEFQTLGCPLLVGVSRKSLIGAVLDKAVGERLYGSLALAVLAASKGARMVRSHDVRATVEALTMTAAVLDTLNDPE